MKIKSASYETDGRNDYLRIVFGADAMPDAVIPDEDAYRWAYRGWPGVFLGPDFEALLPPASIGGQQYAGVSTDPDVIKLAKHFRADLGKGPAEPGPLDVQAILGAE